MSAVTANLAPGRSLARVRRERAGGARGERSSCLGQPSGRRDDGRGRLTLDELLVGVWEGLTAHRSVACPVCGEAMAPRYGVAGAAPVGGRCGDCGATLG
jgi:hypothetical protein